MKILQKDNRKEIAPIHAKLHTHYANIFISDIVLSTYISAQAYVVISDLTEKATNEMKGSNYLEYDWSLSDENLGVMLKPLRSKNLF